MPKYNPTFAFDVPPNSAAAKRLRSQRAEPSTRVAEHRLVLAKRLKREYGSIAAAGRALGFDEMLPGEADGQAAQKAIALLRDPDPADSVAQTAMRAIEVLLKDLDGVCRAAVREMLEQEPSAVDDEMPQNAIERAQSARARNDAVARARNDAVARALDAAIRSPAVLRGVLNPETFFAPHAAEREVAAGSFEQHFRNRGRAA